MKNRIKLLALDLDGTVLRSDNTLSPAVKAAIEKMILRGIEVAAASGRPFGSMHPDVMSIRGLRYVIASNGAAIYENGSRVRSITLNENDVIKLMELTEKYDLIWEAFRDGEICTDSRYFADPEKYGCTKAYVGYVRSSRAHCDNMRGYILDNRKSLDSVEFVCTDKKLRQRLWKEAEEKIPGLYITSSSKNFVEFMDKSATKRGGLLWLCERLNIELKNTAAAGNADNDVDMITAAGLGIAVANASKKCLAAADLTVKSNDEDGIAALRELILPR